MEYTYIKDPKKFTNTYLKSTLEHKIHPTSSTTVYDVGRRVEFMSPTKYLSFESTLPKYMERASQPNEEINRINVIKQKLINKIPIDPLFLLIDSNTNQIIYGDGYHRAVAARELGIKKIPVYIFYISIIADGKSNHYLASKYKDDDDDMYREDMMSNYGSQSYHTVDLKNKQISTKYIPSKMILYLINHQDEFDRKKKPSKPKKRIIKKKSCGCK